MALKSIIIFYSLQKRLKKQFFGAEYNFFVNVARFARKHFLVYLKLVGKPCTVAKVSYAEVFLLDSFYLYCITTVIFFCSKVQFIAAVRA